MKINVECNIIIVLITSESLSYNVRLQPVTPSNPNERELGYTEGQRLFSQRSLRIFLKERTDRREHFGVKSFGHTYFPYNFFSSLT